MSYFILGLPRSRTAWLANFLTYDGHYCHHEAINGCASIQEYKDKIEGCGDSTTNLLMIDFERHFPESKIVVIHRDIKASIDFARTVFKADMTEMLERASDKLNSIKGLHIAFDEINDRLRDIWEYLIGDSFDEKRAQMLIGLNVQTIDVFDIDKEALIKLNNEVTLCHG
ncbi:MAG: hypothetical protein ACYTBJ_24730 [Planctomycetota bacterium]|jgi:hypothetical protein